MNDRGGVSAAVVQAGSRDLDAAIEEWRTEQHLNPSIPVLHANSGRTLPRIKHDWPAPPTHLRAGLAADRSNIELYTGAGTALGMPSRPVSELVAAAHHRR